VVQVLLENGANIEDRDSEGCTTLATAAQCGHVAVVRLLLESGADPTAKDDDGWTALHDAARFGHRAVVQMLLEIGIRAEEKDDEGRTPLDLAAEWEHEEVVQLLGSFQPGNGETCSSTVRTTTVRTETRRRRQMESKSTLGRALKYESLAGSDIRLLTVKPGSGAAPLQCELEHVDLDKSPEFLALSYVWGGDTVKRRIVVNDQYLDITSNLHDALMQFRESFQSAYPLPLWIDAICINQANIRERSAQVIRMRDIYYSATHVMAWLGNPTEGEKQMADLLFDMAGRHRDAFEQGDHPTKSDKASFASQAGDFKQLVHFYVKILHNPWFRRVWVVQEVALADEEPIVMFGQKATPLFSLLSLFTILTYNLPGDLLFDVGLAVENAKPLLGLRSFQRDPSFLVSSFARQLGQLLKLTDGHASTVPHDKIYALLGMTEYAHIGIIEVDVPGYLFPDYSLPFSQVCYRYMKFLMLETGDLTLLATTENHLAGVPSWVPDLRYAHDTKDPPTRASISFTDDGRGLILDGVQVGVIWHVLREIPQGGLPSLPVKMAHYMDAILSPAARARGCSMDEVYNEAIHGMVGEKSFESLGDLLAIIDEWDPKMLEIPGPPEEDPTDLFNQADDNGVIPFGSNPNDTATLILYALGFDINFVTQDGKMGRHFRKDKTFDTLKHGVDDILCVLKGTSFVSRLRPCDKGYTFLGQCEVYGELQEQLFDEDFFSSRSVRQFILV
jgi:hypothetical protein